MYYIQYQASTYQCIRVDKLMGNLASNDVVTNARNGYFDSKNGTVVIKPQANGLFQTQENATYDASLLGVENRLTNKFDEVDYYEIPEAIYGGGFTPTPTPSPTVTPTPSQTPT